MACDCAKSRRTASAGSHFARLTRFRLLHPIAARFERSQQPFQNDNRMVGITPAARSLAYLAGAHARRFSDPKQRSERARGGERGADRHDESKSRHKRFVDHATDQLLCAGV